MKIIAITENGARRILLCGDRYLRQQRAGFINHFLDIEETTEEWIASKWILEYGMKVESDYPTIAEIREKQKFEK